MLIGFLCLEYLRAISPFFITNLDNEGLSDIITEYLVQDFVGPIFKTTWSFYIETVKKICKTKKQSVEFDDLLRNGIKNVLKRMNKHLVDLNPNFFCSSNAEVEKSSIMITKGFKTFYSVYVSQKGQMTNDNIDILKSIESTNVLGDYICVFVLLEQIEAMHYKNNTGILDFWIKYMLHKDMNSQNLDFDQEKILNSQILDINSSYFQCEWFNQIKSQLDGNETENWVFIYVLDSVMIILDEVSMLLSRLIKNEDDAIHEIYDCLKIVRRGCLSKIDQYLYFQNNHFKHHAKASKDLIPILSMCFKYWNKNKWIRSKVYQIIKDIHGVDSKLALVMRGFIETTSMLLESYSQDSRRFNNNLISSCLKNTEEIDAYKAEFSNRHQSVRNKFLCQIEMKKSIFLEIFDATPDVKDSPVYQCFKTFTLKMFLEAKDKNIPEISQSMASSLDTACSGINIPTNKILKNSHDIGITGCGLNEINRPFSDYMIQKKSFVKQPSSENSKRDPESQNLPKSREKDYKKDDQNHTENKTTNNSPKNYIEKSISNQSCYFCCSPLKKEVIATKSDQKTPVEDVSMEILHKPSQASQEYAFFLENFKKSSKKVDQINDNKIESPLSQKKIESMLFNISKIHLKFKDFGKQQDILLNEITQLFKYSFMLTDPENIALNRIYERAKMCSYQYNCFKHELKRIEEFLNKCLLNTEMREPYSHEQTNLDYKKISNESETDSKSECHITSKQYSFIESSSQIQELSTCSSIDSDSSHKLCFSCLMDRWFDNDECFDVRYVDLMIKFFDTKLASKKLQNFEKRIKCFHNNDACPPAIEYTKENKYDRISDQYIDEMCNLIDSIASKKLELKPDSQKETSIKNHFVTKTIPRSDRDFMNAIFKSKLFKEDPSIYDHSIYIKYSKHQIHIHYFDLIKSISEFPVIKGSTIGTNQKNTSIFKESVLNSARNEHEKVFFGQVFDLMRKFTTNQNYIETKECEEFIKKMDGDISIIYSAFKLKDIFMTISGIESDEVLIEICTNNSKNDSYKIRLFERLLGLYKKILNYKELKITNLCISTQSNLEKILRLSKYLDVVEIQQSLSEMDSELQNVLFDCCNKAAQSKTNLTKNHFDLFEKDPKKKTVNISDNQILVGNRSNDRRFSKYRGKKSEVQEHVDDQTSEKLGEQILAKMESNNDEYKTQTHVLKKARQKQKTKNLQSRQKKLSDSPMKQVSQTSATSIPIQNRALVNTIKSPVRDLSIDSDSENISKPKSNKMENYSRISDARYLKSPVSSSHSADDKVDVCDNFQKKPFQQINSQELCFDPKPNPSSFNRSDISTALDYEPVIHTQESPETIPLFREEPQLSNIVAETTIYDSFTTENIDNDHIEMPKNTVMSLPPSYIQNTLSPNNLNSAVLNKYKEPIKSGASDKKSRGEKHPKVLEKNNFQKFYQKNPNGSNKSIKRPIKCSHDSQQKNNHLGKVNRCKLDTKTDSKTIPSKDTANNQPLQSQKLKTSVVTDSKTRTEASLITTFDEKLYKQIESQKSEKSQVCDQPLHINSKSNAENRDLKKIVDQKGKEEILFIHVNTSKEDASHESPGSQLLMGTYYMKNPLESNVTQNDFSVDDNQSVDFQSSSNDTLKKKKQGIEKGILFYKQPNEEITNVNSCVSSGSIKYHLFETESSTLPVLDPTDANRTNYTSHVLEGAKIDFIGQVGQLWSGSFQELSDVKNKSESQNPEKYLGDRFSAASTEALRDLKNKNNEDLLKQLEKDFFSNQYLNSQTETKESSTSNSKNNEEVLHTLQENKSDIDSYNQPNQPPTFKRQFDSENKRLFGLDITTDHNQYTDNVQIRGNEDHISLAIDRLFQEICKPEAASDVIQPETKNSYDILRTEWLRDLSEGQASLYGHKDPSLFKKVHECPNPRRLCDEPLYENFVESLRLDLNYVNSSFNELISPQFSEEKNISDQENEELSAKKSRKNSQCDEDMNDLGDSWNKNQICMNTVWLQHSATDSLVQRNLSSEQHQHTPQYYFQSVHPIDQNRVFEFYNQQTQNLFNRDVQIPGMYSQSATQYYPLLPATSSSQPRVWPFPQTGYYSSIYQLNSHFITDLHGDPSVSTPYNPILYQKPTPSANDILHPGSHPQ